MIQPKFDRTASTLIEMLAAMVLLLSLFSFMALLVRVTMQMYNSTTHSVVTQRVERGLMEQWTRDVHRARDVRFLTSESAELTLPDGRVVRYSADDRSIERAVQRSDKWIARDKYALDRPIQISISETQNERETLLTLEISTQVGANDSIFDTNMNPKVGNHWSGKLKQSARLGLDVKREVIEP